MATTTLLNGFLFLALAVAATACEVAGWPALGFAFYAAAVIQLVMDW